MTISSSTRKAGPFNGNGVTTSFPFAFKVFAAADLRVVLTDTDGVEEDLTLTTDYTVSLNADQDSSPGGTVTYSTLATGEKLTVVGDLDELQPTDITNGGGFYPRIIENALDRAIILIQQATEKISRSVRFPVSDADTAVDLPTASARAGKALVFDVDGNLGVSDSDFDDQAAAAAASAAAAAVSAAAASSSASSASTSATNAAGSASSASTDAAAATGAAASAVAALDAFDDRYLGSKASNPTLDNDGNALLDGALYWNTASKVMRVYDLATTTWQNVNTAGLRTVDTFVAGVDFTAGVATTLTLSASPGGEANIQVYFDAAYQHHSTFTESAGVVTFSSAIPVGVAQVEIIASTIASTGPIGPTGAEGKMIRNGTGAPSSGLGVDGDFYIDTASYSLYGPKASGAWPAPVSLIGPSGSGSGDVIGPASSVDNELVLFSGATGKQIKRATFSGLLKAASGVVSVATAGTDYAPATSGGAILKGNGSGGFSNAAAGTDYAPATSGNAILKGNGSGGFSSAVSGTDYAPATSGTAVLKGNGSGGFSTSVAGTDHVAPGAITGSGLTMATAKLLGRSTASTGAVEEIAVGSGLTLAGGTLSASASGSGKVELLATLTPTAAANVDALNVFTTGYDSYFIEGKGVAPSGGSASLFLRFSSDGSTAITSASYRDGAAAVTGSTMTSTTQLQVHPDIQEAASAGDSAFRIVITNIAAGIQQVDVTCTAVPSAGGYNNTRRMGAAVSGTRLTGFRLYWSSGANFNASGAVRVYGIKNS